jgi:hypothetical protein
MTVHSGDEQIIWEGESQNVTARATGGRFTLHYRLTNHYLYFETGGITATKKEQVPLMAVQDVDVSQTLLQKSRKVGNVLVHIVRQNGARETEVFDSVPEPIKVRDLINQTVHRVRAAVHQRRMAEQQNLGIHRFEYQGGPPQAMPGVPVPPGPLAAGAPAAGVTTDGMGSQQIIDLLRQLGELRDAGVVTAEEFEAKKQDLLGRL